MSVEASVQSLLEKFAEETDPATLDQIEEKIQRLRTLSTS